MKPRDPFTYASPDDPPVKTLLIRTVEELSGKRRLKRLYHRMLSAPDPTRTFWERALAQLDVRINYDPDQLAHVPSEGPVVFVANHPFGVVDGLILCLLAARSRGDFKILINAVLCREEHIAPYVLPIDFSETREALQTNIASKNQALDVLRAGGTIVIFPAGGVATATRPFGPADDLTWKPFVAKLIQMTRATVVPVYFYGQNSRLFQLASQVSLTLRLSLLLREVNKMRGETVQVSIGNPVPYEALAPIRDRNALTAHLRALTFNLAPVAA